MPREHGEGGEFVETVTLDDALETFDHVRGPVILSADVADRLGCTTETARRKLGALYDQGRVDRRSVARRVIYWRPDASESTDESGREPAETAPPMDVDDSPGGEPAARERTETAPDAAAPDDPDDLAAALREYLEATGQNPQTSHGRGVVVDVFRLLREHGTLSTGDLQEAVYPEYRDQWGSERTMWNAVDRYLEDIPGIAKGGYGEWTYAGDDAVREALANSDSDPLDGGVYDPTEEF